MEDSPLHDRLAVAVRGYTLREIGDLTKTHPETVRRYLQGVSPSYEFLSALCRSMGLSGQWLLTGHGPMNASEVRAASLREANPTELLAAMAATLEHLRDRLDRLERYVHTLETRVRAGSAAPNRAGEEAPSVVIASEQPGQRNGQLHAAGDAPGRAHRIADAVAQRPREGDR